MNVWIKRSSLLIAGCLLFLLNACSSADTPNQEAKGNLKKVSIMLDWYPNAVHAGIYDAIEKGYFKNEGIEVDVKMPAETNDPLKLVAAGRTDLALTYQPQVVLSRSEDIPIVSLGALVRHPLNHLMVSKNSPIRSPKDLEGKNVGYPSIPINEAMVKTMVKQDGGNPEKVKMTDVGWDIIPAMAAHKVDGISGGYINHEKILLNKEGHDVRSIDPVKYGVPDYYELVLVSSEDGLKKNRKLYQKFWNALAKGQKDVHDHPDQALNVLFKHENKEFPLDENVEKKSLQTLLPLMDSGKKPFGYQDLGSWKQVSDWLIESKMIKKKEDPKNAFINFEK
ncbi:ABC transporter substrate-binding protein [Fictibacillus terranigra]|uniref:ABC transporter substrate-binding protein n=1 Tax=Fictibacillus terranigra TaxID=3058424 RepID=A0ABT8ECG9_9BACL|nr:ABC transporter substrate-binding protein [Fictibacillus sp. CENA-BCM004]MDN4075595.1 ABC transporter substrate-binding protein [Fictibacillus sp. CENA-BCM004]